MKTVKVSDCKHEVEESKRLIAYFFRIDGKPVMISDCQALIAANIIFLLNLRVEVLCPTQYGKSLVVALATIIRAVSHAEQFTLMGPSEKKARVIMGYVIEHIFDHDLFASQLEIDKGSIEKLKRERSKNKLNFRNGGGIQILTLDARNGKKSVEAAMGFGGKRIIVDEASLIDDVLMATVIRMMGGHPYDDTFLLKIGNPFYRNHFYKSWTGDRYHKIFIDYRDGIREGRYDPRFIEEMREEPLFDIFYECKFPSEDEIDAKGYRQLLKYEELFAAHVDALPDRVFFGGKIGVDVGGGGDKTVFTIRKGNYARMLMSHNTVDTLQNVPLIKEMMEKYKVRPENVYIDDGGIGRGLVERCHQIPELDMVQGISNAGKPVNSDKYINIRAETYFELSKWIKKGGRIVKSDDFKQLHNIKFKKNTADKIQIEPKEDLKKRIGKSPDNEDSLALTFAQGKMGADVLFF